MAIEKLERQIDQVQKRLQNLEKQLEALEKKKINPVIDTGSVDSAAALVGGLNTEIEVLDKHRASLAVEKDDILEADQAINQLTQQFLMINNANIQINVQNNINQTKEDLDKVSEKADKVDKKKPKIEIKTNAESIGKGLEKLGSKMLSVFNPITKKLKSVFSFAGVGKLVKKGVSMITGSLDDAIKRFDELNPTSGIAASISNMKGSVTNGVVEVISSINGVLEETSFGGISNIFDTIGGYFETGLKKVAQIITDNKDEIKPVLESLWEGISWVRDQLAAVDWSTVFGGIKDSFIEFKNMAAGLLDFAKPLVGVAEKLITALGGGDFSAGLGKLPGLFLKIAGGTKLLGKGFQIFDKIKKFDIGSIFGKGKASGGGDKASGGGDTPALGLGGIDWNKQLDKLTNVAVIYAVVKIIEETAEALKQIDEKVPEMSVGFGKKLASMAAALGGMGLFVAGVGKLLDIDGALETAAKGLAGVALLSAELMLAAEALYQIDQKVPSMSADFALKLASIAAAIVEMGVLAGVVGALLATGIGLLIGGLGLAGIALVCADLILCAEALDEVNQKVPSDVSGVIKKIDNIAAAIQAFNNAEMGGLVAVFKNMFKGMNISSVASGLQKFVDIGMLLHEFMSEENAVPDGVEARIGEYEDVINAFNGTTLENLIGNMLQDVNISVITSSVDKLIEIGKKFKQLEEIDYDAGTVINSVKLTNDIIEYISKTSGGGEGIFKKLEKFLADALDLNELNKVNTALDYIVQIAEQLNKLGEIEIDHEDIQKKLEDIVAIVEYISNELFSVVPIEAYTMEQIAGNVDTILEIRDKVNQLGGKGLLGEKARTALNEIAAIINQIGDGMFDGLKFLKDSTREKMSNTIDALAKAREKINILGLGVLYDEAEKAVKDIKKILQLIGDGIIGSQKYLTDDEIDKMVSTVTALVKVKDAINSIGAAGLNYDSAVRYIGGIRTILSLLSYDNFGSYAEAAGGSEPHVGKALDTVAKVMEVTQKLNELGEMELHKTDIQNMILHVKNVIQDLQNFPEVDGIDAIVSLVESFSGLIDQLVELNDGFHEVGKGFGERIIQGFTDAEVQTNIISMIDALIADLEKQSYKDKFTNIGKSWGEALITAFQTQIKQMSGLVSEQVDAIAGLSESMRSAGTSLGNTFYSSFKTEIEQLSGLLDRQITAMNSSLNRFTYGGIELIKGTPIYQSTGGIVPEHYSKGGIAGIFKRKGTDTVPAMLTPGEGILRRSVVRALGTGFVSKLNNMDIQGAINSLTVGNIPGLNTVTNNVTYNYYKNDNSRYNQNVSTNNPGYAKMRLRTS